MKWCNEMVQFQWKTKWKMHSNFSYDDLLHLDFFDFFFKKGFSLWQSSLLHESIMIANRIPPSTNAFRLTSNINRCYFQQVAIHQATGQLFSQWN